VKKRVGDMRLQSVLDYLAEQEDEHARKFEELCSNEATESKLENAFAEARDLLFFNLDTPMERKLMEALFTDEKAALRFALEAEQNSIDFYSAVLRNLDDRKLTEPIQRIIDEEREHYQDISTFLRLQERSEEDPLADKNEAEKKLSDAIDADHEKRDKGGQ
jgi:rubrerythrin